MQVPSFLSGESLTRLLQGAAAGFVLTVAIGFNWFGPGFGWVTGGTTEKIANNRAETALIAILAPICAEKFLAQSDVAAKTDVAAKKGRFRKSRLLEAKGRTCKGMDHAPWQFLSELRPCGCVLGRDPETSGRRRQIVGAVLFLT
jgi:hypothetical protein